MQLLSWNISSFPKASINLVSQKKQKKQKQQLVLQQKLNKPTLLTSVPQRNYCKEQSSRQMQKMQVALADSSNKKQGHWQMDNMKLYNSETTVM